jgi:hypothetical protein
MVHVNPSGLVAQYVEAPMTRNWRPFQEMERQLPAVRVAREVQVIPFVLVQMFVAASDTAAQMFPFHAMPPYPSVEAVMGSPMNVQAVPFVLTASEFTEPAPKTRSWLPFQPMRYPPTLNDPVFTNTRAVQLIPSGLVAIQFVPVPAAIQSFRESAQRISKPLVEKMVVVVRPVHVIPSGLVAIEFVPEPTATQIFPFHATSRALVVIAVVAVCVHVLPLSVL